MTVIIKTGRNQGRTISEVVRDLRDLAKGDVRWIQATTGGVETSDELAAAYLAHRHATPDTDPDDDVDPEPEAETAKPRSRSRSRKKSSPDNTPADGE